MMNQYNPNYPNVSQVVVRGAKSSYGALERVNIMSLLKVFAVVVVLIIVFMFGASIFKSVKKMFGIEGSVFAWLTGNGSGGGDGAYDKEKKKEEQERAKGEANAGKYKPYSDYRKYLTPSNIKVDSRYIVDKIQELLDGADLIAWDSTIKEVNKLAKRNEAEVILAARYWEEAYMSANDGYSLYKFLEDQTTYWKDGASYFQPAMSKLKNFKLTGKVPVRYPNRK